VLTGFVRDCTLNLPPGTPGKTYGELQEELKVEQMVLLNANENCVGPSPKAIEAIWGAAAQVNRYPDSSSKVLRQEIADMLDLSPDMVAFSTGGDNILMSIAHAYLNEGDEVLLGSPSFYTYISTTVIMGAKLVKVPLKDLTFDLEAMAERITDKTKLIMVCNPNNPTATIVRQAEVDAFMKKVPEHCIVIFDEAYGEMVQDPDYPDSLAYVRAGRNVIVLHTLSKIYGLAGLRVGYCIGPKELIAPLYRVLEVYPVNCLAQAAALAALEDTDHVELVKKTIIEEREYLEKEFTALGMTYAPSQANFIFVDLKTPAAPVVEGLLKRGIMVRSGETWGHSNHVRISVGNRAENIKLIAALREIKADSK